jgi:AcrR family transcriptional regulator
MPSAAASRAARQEETRAALVETAARMFMANGYHATSLDAIAREAGFTKGAVYANFQSKEDLFLEVHAQRAQRFVEETAALIDELGPAETIHRLARETSTRRGRDDGWLAVYFEFWAHVLRNPRLRERFAALRAKSRTVFEAALSQAANDSGVRPLQNYAPAVVAMNALQVGLALERLTDPDLVPPTLGERISRLALENLDPSLLEEGT